MKKILVIGLMLFFIVSCTQFETSDSIYPEVSLVGNTVGLKYTIGPFEVIDSLEGLDDSVYDYIVSHKDEANWSLNIRYDSLYSSQSKFRYYINDVHILTNRGVIKKNILIMERNRMPNWICNKGDCQPSNNKNIKNKIDN